MCLGMWTVFLKVDDTRCAFVLGAVWMLCCFRFLISVLADCSPPPFKKKEDVQ